MRCSPRKPGHFVKTLAAGAITRAKLNAWLAVLKAKQVDETIAGIAKTVLGLETLAFRNRDSLDFHELDVGTIRDALLAAFQAGEEAAKR